MAQANAYIQNMQAMQNIVAMMKEVPVLPSEVVPENDNNRLQRVEFPEGSGPLTFMENYKYPYKGFPFYEFVDKIDVIKKISRSLQSGIFHGLKGKNKFVLYLLIPFVPLFGRNIFWAFTYSFHRLIERFRIKPQMYCTSVKEVHRAWSKDRDGESAKTKDLRFMLRDIECMILEYDNAYRFRMQDILPHLDKEALRADPIAEICRLLDIEISRELLEEKKDSWRLLQMFAKYFMRYDKELLKIFVDLLLEVDLTKVALDEGDIEFASKRKDYIFGFMK